MESNFVVTLCCDFQTLVLKVGCPVMLLKNITPKLCNGLQGVVVALTQQTARVRFASIGVDHTFTKCTFTK